MSHNELQGVVPSIIKGFLFEIEDSMINHIYGLDDNHFTLLINILRNYKKNNQGKTPKYMTNITSLNQKIAKEKNKK